MTEPTVHYLSKADLGGVQVFLLFLFFPDVSKDLYPSLIIIIFLKLKLTTISLLMYKKLDLEKVSFKKVYQIFC